MREFVCRFAALSVDIFNSIVIMYAMHEFYENQKMCSKCVAWDLRTGM
jgi:hypothetical protein